MLTPILMGVCILIGLIIAIPPVLELESVKNILNKSKEFVPALPPVIPTPTGPTPEVEVVPVAPAKPTRSKLAHIVTEWENFVDTLVINGMDESAEDMKTLLNKMVDEYRSDLNEDDVDEKVASIDSIIAPSEEKGE